MTTPVRITAVSYLNTLPFIYGIEQAILSRLPAGEESCGGEGIVLSLEIPSLCAAAAVNGTTDIALVPVAAIPQIPGFSSSIFPTASCVEKGVFTPEIITDYCIGAEGAVGTVVLLSDTPIEQIHTVYLDAHSRTSVQLVRVLAREHWGIRPEWVDFADCQSTAATVGGLRPGEGMVAIGDKVFALTDAYQYTHKYDLAAEWGEFTRGLPFTFAAWVACTPAGLAFAPVLNRALAYGVGHIGDSIAGTVNRSREFEFAPSYHYLTEHIKFRLDAPKREAMKLFWEKIITPG